MAQLIYAHQTLDDLERITDVLLASEPPIASSTLALIVEAVEVLQNHPRIGRAVMEELRELVI